MLRNNSFLKIIASGQRGILQGLQQECMKELFALIENEFADDEFRTGIRKCFRSTGLCYREDKSFVEFSFESSGGTFPIAHTGTVAAYPRSAER